MVEVYVSYWYLLELPRRENSKNYPHPNIEKISPYYLCCPILSVSMHLKVPCPGNICLLSQRSILLNFIKELAVARSLFRSGLFSGFSLKFGRDAATFFLKRVFI